MEYLDRCVKVVHECMYNFCWFSLCQQHKKLFNWHVCEVGYKECVGSYIDVGILLSMLKYL